MFNIFGKCYVLQDIRLEDLLRLREALPFSFWTADKHPPSCLYCKSHYVPQCPPTNLPSTNTSYCDTLIIPSCMQPIPSHEYVMPKNESYSHSRRPAANKYNLSITHWPVKNYRKPTEAGRRLGLAIRRSGNYYTLSLKKWNSTAITMSWLYRQCQTRQEQLRTDRLIENTWIRVVNKRLFF